MDLIDPQSSTLVLVDYQARLMPAIFEAPAVVAQAQLLADAAQALGMTIVGTEQNPQGLGPNVQALRQRCVATLPKSSFDACTDGLLEWLSDHGAGATQIVIAGCEAHVCLMQTALGLRRAGRRVWVVAPACGSRQPRDHALAMARLQQAGAVIVSVEMVLFEWLRSCKHPQFKPVLSRLKGA